MPEPQAPSLQSLGSSPAVEFQSESENFEILSDLASCSRMFAPSVPQDIHLWSATLPFTFPLTSTGFCSLPLNEKTCPARSLCQFTYCTVGPVAGPHNKRFQQNRDRHLDKSVDYKLPRGARLRHTECRRLVRFAQPDSWPGQLH